MAGDDLSRTTTVRRKGPKQGKSGFPSLKVVYSPDAQATGMEYALDGSSYFFGRSDLVSDPINDDRMSRQHFRVVPGESGYLIEDLDSTNGTFLDGRKINGRFPLDGDVVCAGDTILVMDGVPDFDALPSAPGVEGGMVRGIVGSSNAMRALRAAVATVAPTAGGVLLLGPTGAGKEVTARAIHEASGRDGPFVPINCAAIPANLAESEFFGHEKGAFTGAEQARQGAFRESSGGTLFLDEVGDLPSSLQAKLLRVLEDSVVQPLGGSVTEKVDLRVVAATHINLDQSEFRRDLLARLCDWVLHLPPLKQRKADVLTLWRHFVRLEGYRGPEEDAELFEALLLHDWPMNVRELRKLARRLVILAGDTGSIGLSTLPEEMRRPITLRYSAPEIFVSTNPTPPPAPSPTGPIPSVSSDETLDPDGGIPRREDLEVALAKARGNVKLAAQQNGWHRTQLYRWLKRQGVDPARFR